MIVIALALMAVQALVMLVDEFYFHRRRGLPRWERIGHPIDTASVLACYLATLLLAPTRAALLGYTVLAVLSCLLITKDELVHAARCEPLEHWLHALLFLVHPVLLIAVALIWIGGARAILLAQSLVTCAFGLYQAVYWNVLARPAGRSLE